MAKTTRRAQKGTAPRRRRAAPASAPSGDSWRIRITSDPAVLVGKPVIRGTRISVEFVIGLLSAGWSEQEILDNYAGITSDDIRACLEYAGHVLSTERILPIPGR